MSEVLPVLKLLRNKNYSINADPSRKSPTPSKVTFWSKLVAKAA